MNLKLRHAEKQSNALAAGLDLGAGKKDVKGCPQSNLESALIFSFTRSFWHHIWAIFCFAFSALGSSKANASLAELRLGLGFKMDYLLVTRCMLPCEVCFALGP